MAGIIEVIEMLGLRCNDPKLFGLHYESFRLSLNSVATRGFLVTIVMPCDASKFDFKISDIRHLYFRLPVLTARNRI